MRSKIIRCLLACLLIVLCVCNLVWLAMGISIYILVWYAGRLNIRSIQYLRKQSIIRGICMLLIIFFSTILFRVFIAEIYNVPSESMEDTLLNGDNILLSKLHYGPKLPATPDEIPWFNLFYLLNKKLPDTNKTVWPYRRLSGFSNIHAGDILVFNMPDVSSTPLIKRCAGAPGDTLLLNNDTVYVNGNMLPFVNTAQQPYAGTITDMSAFQVLMEDLNVVYQFDKQNKNSAHANLSYKEKQQLLQSGSASAVLFEPVFDDKHPHVHPWDTSFAWRVDHYGPVLIPAKGTGITMNKHNYLLYRKIIEQHEQTVIQEHDQHYFINNQEIKEYRFKQDYCFVLGDNRQYSNDSRYWGFVPVQNIEGKAVCILYSRTNGRLNWRRFFKFL